MNWCNYYNDSNWSAHMASWYTEIWTQYLALLQSDLALFFAANERPVTPEHSVTSVHNMGKGRWEETHPVLNHPLGEKKSSSIKYWTEILQWNMTLHNYRGKDMPPFVFVLFFEKRSYLFIEWFDSENSILMFAWLSRLSRCHWLSTDNGSDVFFLWCGGITIKKTHHTLVLALLYPWLIFHAFVPRSGPLPRSYNLWLDFL